MDINKLNKYERPRDSTSYFLLAMIIIFIGFLYGSNEGFIEFTDHLFISIFINALLIPVAAGFSIVAIPWKVAEDKLRLSRESYLRGYKESLLVFSKEELLEVLVNKHVDARTKMFITKYIESGDFASDKQNSTKA